MPLVTIAKYVGYWCRKEILPLYLTLQPPSQRSALVVKPYHALDNLGDVMGPPLMMSDDREKREALRGRLTYPQKLPIVCQAYECVKMSQRW